MDWQPNMSIQSLQSTGRVILLEAESGQARRNLLQQWLNEAQESGASTWFLSCDRDEGGPWAGLKDLLSDLVSEVKTHAPDLIIKHDYELANVLPALRRSLSIRNPTLTDSAVQEERVRLYPADRAFRIVHGLIDFLATCYQSSSSPALVIACDRFDYAGALVRRFFVELMRRRSQQINLTLLIATDRAVSEDITAEFDTKYLGQRLRLNLPADPNISVSKEKMAQLAQELEQRLGNDPIEIEIHLPQLIRYWLMSDQPEKALTYQMKASSIYAHRGFYKDGLAYCEAALSQLERKCPENMHNRWILYFRLYNCYIVLGKPLQALQVMETAMSEIDSPEYLFHCCYMKAMLYARHLPDHDLVKAEAYLEQGLEELARVDLPKHAKLFHTAFNRNGLALIRHRQGRSQEAVELCLSYYEQLNAHLKPDEHLLHRSVLLYNTAQVYAAISLYEEAITHFTTAMAIDPNYSEYYNERGNVYVKIGRLKDAMNDYLMAIDLSPPYPEVWANLGRCYRMIDQMAKAVDAYSTSLDLDPNQFSVLVARGEVYEILEQPDAALADYNSALVLDASQPLVLANRAILHYDAGRYQEALDDLDLALALSPETLDLYQNRAIALIALGRFEDAAHNLRTYLKLNPTAEDRLEVENMLVTL